MEELDFNKVEKKWQKRWEEEKVFEIDLDSDKKKYYILEMFPYPSASGLHMGHTWNYTIGDVLARFKRMNGFNVLYPMGFDAMGLPAENAAIKAGEHPKPFTERAIKNYIRQMKEIGLSYDWSKTLSTMDPGYYKWNQYFFLKFLESGLVYRKKSAVNWCPQCNSVLANEQVHGGRCWRHEDVEVEIKYLDQWYLKTTKYSEELLVDLEDLDWPERIKAMQRNWIGKSFGTEIDFEINGKVWPVFTTRPDTLFGVTFLVISAQHPGLKEIVTKEQEIEVEKFLKKIRSVSEKEMELMEKEGVFTGSYAINPATNEKVPIYAGNFVVADYGGGMVMAVPSHDQRDFEFAKKYGIEVKQVIEGNVSDSRAYTGEGVLINSKEFNGLESEEAKKKISEWLISKNKARNVTNYKLRDWGFSRQRYWGTPIPIVHCEKCGIVPVSEKDLPIILPEKVTFGKGNPLETNEEWIKTKCPKCGLDARRETETMDTFFDSSWYFLRYVDNLNGKEPFSKELVSKWLPTNKYIGGAEHACMHLIYSRFFTKALRDMGSLNFNEPFLSLFNQGMLHGEDGEKMSKSKGNVINPDDVSKRFGMDTARFFLCSLASPEKDIDWDENGIQGSLRFIRGIYSWVENVKFGSDSVDTEGVLNRAIKDITSQIEGMEYRKATIVLRTLFEHLLSLEEVSKSSLESAFILLSPFCPHIAEEVWEKIGNSGFISVKSWPKFDESKIKKEKGEVDLNQKVLNRISEILEKLKQKEGEWKKIFLYTIPGENEKYDENFLQKELGVDVKVFSVKDNEKYDPENRSKKALPSFPGIYVE